MRRLPASICALSIVVAGCTLAEDEPTAETDDAVSVTDRPGEAVWTKVFRPEVSARAVAEDLASDASGDGFVVRSERRDGFVTVDANRYSPTGQRLFRNVVLRDRIARLLSAKIGAGGGISAAAVAYDRDGTGRARTEITGLAEGGSMLFQRALTSKAGSVSLEDLALDDDGDIVVVGETRGPIEIGAVTACPTVSGRKGFVVKLDRRGEAIFGRCFDGGTTVVRSVAIDGAGTIHVGGFFSGSIAFGRDRFRTVDAFADGFLASLSKGGDVMRATPLGGVRDQIVDSVAVTRGGRVAFAGRFHGTLDCVGAPLSHTGTTTTEGYDLFLGKLDVRGERQFCRAFDGTGRRQIADVAIDGYGQVILAGTFDRTLEIDGATLSKTQTSMGHGFVLKTTALSGRTIWHRRYGDGAANGVTLHGLAVTRSDRLLAGGSFVGTFSLGDSSITSSHDFDARDGIQSETGFFARLHQ
jgi:hypothetical protein